VRPFPPPNPNPQPPKPSQFPASRPLHIRRRHRVVDGVRQPLVLFANAFGDAIAERFEELALGVQRLGPVGGIDQEQLVDRFRR